MAGDSPAAIIFNIDGYEVDTVTDAANLLGLHTTSPFTIDREKLVAVNFGKENISNTTHFVLIDLDGPDYKHSPGSAVIISGASAQALKSVSGSKWDIALLVVLRIDGTNADLGVLPLASVFLRDTSKFSDGGTIITFPSFIDLTVSGGDFTKIANGLKETNVAAVNTGITFEDALGNSVTPAVGDVLIRTDKVSGAGNLEFVYSMQYFVE